MTSKINQGSRSHSAQQWHRQWLKIIKQFVRKHKVISAFSACALVIIVTGLAILIEITNNAGTTDKGFIRSLDDGVNGIFLLGHIYKINADDRTLSATWLVSGCGSFRSKTAIFFKDSTNCGPLNVAANIYVDGASNPSFMYDPKSHPLAAENGSIPLYSQDTDQFKKTHLLNVWTQELKLGKMRRYFDQQYLYPFERFQLVTSAFALSPSTNRSLPVARMSMTDFNTNFDIFDSDDASVSQRNGTLVDSRSVHLYIQRTKISIIFTLMLCGVNWALTLMAMYITVVALVATNRTIGEGIIILPVTVILTLPALRALFIDSPPFGRLIDLLGFFMQMIIVAVCSIILLIWVILNPPHTTKRK